MLCALIAAYAGVVPVAAIGHSTLAGGRGLAGPEDSAATAAVAAEVRAFYLDLDAQNWAPLLNRFIPAKVTARWAAPTTNVTWTRLAAPDAVAREAAGPCEPRAAVAVVGDWARVRVRRCAAPPDEAWLLRVSGRWKIVHLELATPPVRLVATP